MDQARIGIILGMGLLTYLIRSIPLLFFVGWNFPAAFDRYLRYLAYTLIMSTISISLFLTGPRFDVEAAPHRFLALLAAVFVASWSRSPLLGMLFGTLLAILLPMIPLTQP